MFPLAACRPKSPGTPAPAVPVRLLGQVEGVGETAWAGLGLSADTIQTERFLARAGTLTEFHVRTSWIVDVHMAIYSDASGSPGDLLAQTAITEIHDEWCIVPVVTPVALSATYYWLALNMSVDGRIYRTHGDAGTSRSVVRLLVDGMPASMPATDADTEDFAIAGWGSL
jgi:hypothetical protein